MTTVLDKQTRDAAVHAFVIGVGAYRHLPGGSGPLMANTLGLEQIQEPALSARAFLDWLTGDYPHPSGVPLGSIELLMSTSDDPYRYDGHDIAPADLPNAQLAASSWIERCNANKANVTLFYFCGHGFARDHQYLLLEDFGQAPLNPMSTSIDLNRMRYGMARCEADTQIFISDACRQVKWDLLKTFDTLGDPLIPPIMGGNADRNTPVLLATRKGGTALGAPGQVTYFTQALLAALRGAGGEDPGNNDTWVVRYRKLADAVQDLLTYGPFGPATGERQCCRTDGESENVILGHLPGPPLVSLQIDYDPPESAEVATLSLDSSHRNFHQTRNQIAGPWQLKAPASCWYQLQASYLDGTSWSRPVAVLPPLPRVPAVHTRRSNAPSNLAPDAP
ncbi:caspase family protein [Streptomyces sp. NBC_00487]|uniref:caspase family protein n=1 Tax=unclassified Streptomyces TaxID=2593676 RepID=UPI002E182C43|nr:MULTISPECIES: caspase family protein [unclassified Streptomyces]